RETQISDRLPPRRPGAVLAQHLSGAARQHRDTACRAGLCRRPAELVGLLRLTAHGRPPSVAPPSLDVLVKILDKRVVFTPRWRAGSRASEACDPTAAARALDGGLRLRSPPRVVRRRPRPRTAPAVDRGQDMPPRAPEGRGAERSSRRPAKHGSNPQAN